MDDQILNLINTIGFPTVICFYLLKSVVKSIDKNTTAIDALRDEINRLTRQHHQ